MYGNTPAVELKVISFLTVGNCIVLFSVYVILVQFTKLQQTDESPSASPMWAVQEWRPRCQQGFSDMKKQQEPTKGSAKVREVSAASSTFHSFVVPAVP